METTIQNFGQLYHPTAMLVFYEGGKEKQPYVEHFAIDPHGVPCNAHPLTVEEAKRLARSLYIDNENNGLNPENILGTEILSFNPIKAKVVWYTKAQVRYLYFTDHLGIKDGIAWVPPMLWIADREQLNVYALAIHRRPTVNTDLYHAPFFNVYENGNVCMGSVDIDLTAIYTLEEFTKTWESYFFSSRFSHLLAGHNPVNGNCVQLWEKLIAKGTDEKFPKEMLLKTNFKLKNIL